MSLEQKIIHCLKSVISIDHVEITDDTNNHIHHVNFDGGAHLSTIIVSADFTHKSLLERHRLVYKALNSMIKKEIHALSIKAYTPVEWITLKEQ